MIRAIFRLVIVLVLLGVAVAFFMGYRWGTHVDQPARPEPVVGTTGTVTADRSERTERAREAGAEIGEKVAVGADRAAAALGEARLTAKVKSKIALDDTLKGTDVSVRTSGSSVTVEGRVSSAAQRQRVLQLTRETSGVTAVVDRLTVRP